MLIDQIIITYLSLIQSVSQNLNTQSICFYYQKSNKSLLKKVKSFYKIKRTKNDIKRCNRNVFVSIEFAIPQAFSITKAKMKFVSLFVLFCVAISLVHSVNVVTWGNVNGQEIGKQTVVVKSSMWQVKKTTFNFPDVSQVHLV